MTAQLIDPAQARAQALEALRVAYEQVQAARRAPKSHGYRSSLEAASNAWLEAIHAYADLHRPSWSRR